MPVWIVIGVAAAIFVLVIVIAASFNVFSAESVEEEADSWVGLPTDFTSADVEAMTFRPALRGYRMDDVDEAVELLRERISELESALSHRQHHTAATASIPIDSAPTGSGASTSDDSAETARLDR